MSLTCDQQIRTQSCSAEGGFGRSNGLEWQSQQRESWVVENLWMPRQQTYEHETVVGCISQRGRSGVGVVAFAFTGQYLSAQSGRASITGVVTDSSGAVVQDVNVTATNAATGVATSAKTNQSGAYSLLQLPAGSYSLRVEKVGFSSQLQENFVLVAEQSAGVNFALRPGQVSERINVEANSELIHTESAEISQTINEHAIVELPLNGRNPAELVLLAPGTVNVLNVSGAGNRQDYTTFPTETGASSNGGRQGSTLLPA